MAKNLNEELRKRVCVNCENKESCTFGDRINCAMYKFDLWNMARSSYDHPALVQKYLNKEA